MAQDEYRDYLGNLRKRQPPLTGTPDPTLEERERRKRALNDPSISEPRLNYRGQNRDLYGVGRDPKYGANADALLTYYGHRGLDNPQIGPPPEVAVRNPLPVTRTLGEREDINLRDPAIYKILEDAGLGYLLQFLD
jgi:hypothetical protein